MNNKLLVAFIVFYALYLLSGVNPYYLDSDEGSYALTGVFFNRLISDWVSNPVFNPQSLFLYAKSYYVSYPKLMFLNGPLFHLFTAGLSNSVLAMKLLVVASAVMTVLLSYFITLRLFKSYRYRKPAAFISMILTATSRLFVSSSVSLLLDVPSLCFFAIGLLLYYKKRSIPAGLFFGFSILVKDIALPYVGILLLVSFRDLRKRWRVIVGLGLVVIPYVLMIVASGSASIFLDYPRKQLWYVERQGDPQWYDLAGWFYFPQLLIVNYSWVALPLFLGGLFFAYKRGYHRELLFLFFAFLVVTVMSDKAERRIINSVLFISPLIALAWTELYSSFRGKWSRLAWLSLLLFMITIQLPLVFPKISTPMPYVARELVNDCPNCTVLIASEIGAVYSSSLMYEALILDSNASMRFIRPIAFESRDVLEVIVDENVNRVVVIGDPSFLESDPENAHYFPNIVFIINSLELLSVYESDIVGHVYVFDTGLIGVKESPYCVASPSIGSTFCTDFLNPVDALKL